jgi:hypothetical protein
MRHRGARQYDVVGAQLEPLGGARGDPTERLQRVGHAFCRTGAARGKEDERGRGGVRSWKLADSRFLFDQRFKARGLAVIRRVTDHAAWQPARELARRQVPIPLSMGNQYRRATHFERVVDLRSHVTVVEWRCHQPGLHTGDVVEHELATIRHERRNPVARFEAETQQVRRQPVAGLVQLAPTEA